ncbi:MAG TPA: XrtA system polysaccharide chain length determinant [Burkholderiales bacterium]|nr:XrtA system polysaccharide chain length determinant [Burkholderiales bacterium]
MDTFVPQLTEILRGLWQGRWVGLAVAWLAGLAGAAYIFVTPDKYEATARVYVDTQSILKPLMAGLTVQPDVEQQVAILSRTLISRPNMEKLVRMTDMDLNVKSAEQRERLVDYLMKALYIKSLGRDNLYTIGFLDPDPTQARRVVQSLLSIFVESGLSEKGNDTARAQHFIDEQIKAYAQRLNDAENRVKDFKLKHMDLEDGAGTDYYGGLSALAEKLRQAKLQLLEANQSREALKKQVADQKAHPAALAQADDTSSALATPDLDARIDTLKKNLDELRLRFTDNYPDVINTQTMIKELEEQRKDRRKQLRQELEKQQQSGTSGDSSDPVYQQLKLALADSDAQIAGLRARVADYESRYKNLRAKARSVPEVQAEFERLNRDYGIEKQNYDSLVKRRESAVMSGQMEQATGVANFRVIDPPRVSRTPVSPDRKLLIPLALFASLCAGFAASYLFSVVHPTIHDNRGLKAVGRRPVLGAVSLIRNAQVLAKRRRRAVLFFGGLGGLAATYGAAIAFVFVRSLIAF